MLGYQRITLDLPDQEDVIAIVCLVRRVLVINTKARAGAKLVLIKQTV